ncbi:MAG: hypothetical protein ACTH31_06735 [Pseudoclavibacter sp.]
MLLLRSRPVVEDTHRDLVAPPSNARRRIAVRGGTDGAACIAWSAGGAGIAGIAGITGSACVTSLVGRACFADTGGATGHANSVATSRRLAADLHVGPHRRSLIPTTGRNELGPREPRIQLRVEDSLELRCDINGKPAAKRHEPVAGAPEREPALVHCRVITRLSAVLIEDHGECLSQVAEFLRISDATAAKPADTIGACVVLLIVELLARAFGTTTLWTSAIRPTDARVDAVANALGECDIDCFELFGFEPSAGVAHGRGCRVEPIEPEPAARERIAQARELGWQHLT